MITRICFVALPFCFAAVFCCAVGFDGNRPRHHIELQAVPAVPAAAAGSAAAAAAAATLE